MSDSEDQPRIIRQNPDDTGPMVIKSLCVACGKNGKTRMLLTSIPHYRDVVVSSFYCKHCGNINNDVQSTGTIQEQGEKLTLTVSNLKDLNRQVIKSDSCTVFAPSLGLEIPSTTQRGTLNTVEGILKVAAEGLRDVQMRELKAIQAASSTDAVSTETMERCTKLDEFCERLEKASNGDASVLPFDIILDDPAGNSYVENLFAPDPDPALVSEKYWRTPQQVEELGFQPDRPTVAPTTAALPGAAANALIH